MRSFILASALVLLPVAAQAGNASDINTCKAAVADAVANDFDAPVITFEGIRGASVKKVTFTVSEGDKDVTAVCKIKRGKVLDVDV